MSNLPLPSMRPKIVLRDSVIVVALAAIVALAFNFSRQEGIALVASKPYETMVPCPVPTGPAKPLAAGDVLPVRPTDLLVDARGKEEFAAWKAPGAISVPFDWLDPTPKHLIKKILKKRARRVIVYGDGGNPDSGEQLAKEVASKNLKNVFFVKGGVKALRRALKRSSAATPPPGKEKR